MKRVRISASELRDHQRLEAIIRSIEPLPAMRIRGAEVERLVEENAHVERSSFAHNIFGRGFLKVVYREPVATVRGNYAVDGGGEIFPSLGGNLNLPTIEGNVQVTSPILTLCDPGPFRTAARYAKKLQFIERIPPGRLAIGERGGISYLGGSLLVEFGDGSRLQEKVEVFKKALEQRPELLNGKARLNLVDPDDPMSGN
ncbi:MAG: hypothetical protein H0W86_02815 [Armatimonadetes bacterium]|nr:hypothetical protein [Armatimonadota bacterium]